MVNSFDIDHRTLKAGVYEREQKYMTKTWDVRFVAPAEHEYMTPGAMHVLEHFFAFNLRREKPIGDKVIAVCPMGCLTGMYVITSLSATMYEMVEGLMGVLKRFPLLYLDDVPGMNVMQCGNPQLNDIKNANLFARRLYDVLTNTQPADKI